MTFRVRPRRTPDAIGWLALVLPLLACAEPEGPGACSTVLAPDAWVDGGPEPRFVESWRAGGTRVGEELALPIAAAVGPDGDLAIVDFQLGVVSVGPDGSWKGVLTRRGEGPGEVESAVAAAWTDAGHVAVLDLLGGALVVHGADGALLRETPLDPTALAPIAARGELAAVALSERAGALLQTNEPGPESSDVRQVVIRLPADGGAADTLADRPTTGLASDWRPARSLVAPGFPRLVYAAASDGRIALAGLGDGYEVTLLLPDGTRSVLCRDDEGHPLRPDERGEPGSEAPPADPLAEAIRAAPRPERPFPIGRLLFGRGGRLWIERARPSVANPIELLTGRTGSTFDVFDRSGRYLGALTAPAGAKIIAVAGDRVWGLELGEHDESWLVAYELSPPG